MGGIGAEIGVIGMGHGDMNHAAITTDSVELLDDLKENRRLLTEMFQHVMPLNLLGYVVVKWPGETLEVNDAIRLAARMDVDIDKTVEMAAATTQIHTQLPSNRYTMQQARRDCATQEGTSTESAWACCQRARC